MMRPEGFVKLYGDLLLTSSIWLTEPAATRIVWITLLVLADKDGYVVATVPSLAREAQVSLEECERAIAVLEAPDPYSRTKDHEGRRIAPTETGWLVLNRAKYRDMRTRAQTQAVERTRRWRERKKSVNGDGGDAPVTSHSVTNAQREEIRDISLFSGTNVPSKRDRPTVTGDGGDAPPSRPPQPFDQAYDLWVEKAGAVNYGRLKKSLAPLKIDPTDQTFLDALTLFLAARSRLPVEKQRWETPEVFAATYATWAEMAQEPLHVDGVLTRKGELLSR